MNTELKKSQNKDTKNIKEINSIIKEIKDMRDLNFEEFNSKIVMIDVKIKKNQETIKELLGGGPSERAYVATLINEWSMSEAYELNEIYGRVKRSYHMSTKSEMSELYVYTWTIKKMHELSKEVFKNVIKDKEMGAFVTKSDFFVAKSDFILEAKEKEVLGAIFPKAKNNRGIDNDVYKSIKGIMEEDFGIYNDV